MPGPDDEMEVIRLHRPREAAGPLFRQYPAESIERGSAVLVIEKQVSSVDASGEDMVHDAGGIEPRSARHAGSPRDLGAPTEKQARATRARARKVDNSNPTPFLTTGWGGGWDGAVATV